MPFVKAHTGSAPKASGTTMTVTLTSAVPAGNTLIVGASFDNLTESTPTGLAETGWTNVGFSDGGVGISAASTGGGWAHVHVWARTSDGSAAFASGATFTFDISAAVVARAIAIAEFSGINLASLVVTGTGRVVTTGTIASGTTATATAISDVLFWVAGANRNTAPTINSDGTNTDADFAVAASSVTSGGGSASNIGVTIFYDNATTATEPLGAAKAYGDAGSIMIFVIRATGAAAPTVYGCGLPI